MLFAHAYQLGLAAISKRQVAIDGHKAVARATKLEVLDLDYIARDRRVPAMISRRVGVGDRVWAVESVDDGLVLCFALIVTCPSDFSSSNKCRAVFVWCPQLRWQQAGVSFVEKPSDNWDTPPPILRNSE